MSFLSSFIDTDKQFKDTAYTPQFSIRPKPCLAGWCVGVLLLLVHAAKVAQSKRQFALVGKDGNIWERLSVELDIAQAHFVQFITADWVSEYDVILRRCEERFCQIALEAEVFDYLVQGLGELFASSFF